MNTVLLTGISGYIGLHSAKQLLEAGYTVRGTVRSQTKGQEVRNTLTAASVDTKNLTIVELDLTSDRGWDDAAKGCDFVMHMASPFVIANPKDPQALITPAVDGSLRALRAAKKAGVKRVVLTSSVLSMMGSMKTGTFGPSDWTDIDAPDVSTYTKSKTLAEKAAWDFVNSQEGDDQMELTVIAPGGVFGPPLGRNITGQSMSMLDQMLRGKLPMVPKAAFPMVDVRDVAKLHVQALTLPEATGKRFIAASAEPNGFQSAAQFLKDEGYKGPSTRIAPDFLLRLMAKFDREAKGMLGLLGMHLSSNNSETRELFGWTPIPFQQSVLETAKAVKTIQGKA
ncbi:aldehyde reductase [Aliiroseovarius sp. KMU-50]|uniref:Aldehyde reductase n=1 Tax=Aliiroseovarius salicola TaxID=3009082 RepID=A0ABT4VZS5_9RHOB|nr:aldehyde reductase [Aliiroseovarius sp. KMU-50]MDA5093235.1 aldehyde reductase [Aliiroseovarius sp. KMU-50]